MKFGVANWCIVKPVKELWEEADELIIALSVSARGFIGNNTSEATPCHVHSTKQISVMKVVEAEVETDASKLQWTSGTGPDWDLDWDSDIACRQTVFVVCRPSRTISFCPLGLLQCTW